MCTQADWALLNFVDGWEQLNTKDLSWLDVLKTTSDEVQGLETLRGIDSLRRSTSCKQSSINDGVELQHLDKMQQYLGELEQLMSKLALTGAPASTSFVSHWTSPLSARPPYHMYKLNGLAAELGMATFQYGNALRAVALKLLSASSRPPSDSGAATDTATAGSPPAAAGAATGAGWASAAAEASSLFRRAAGAFVWLLERGLPRVAHQLPADSPVELVMSMSKVMSLVCLAEAQVVAACRACQRGVSPALVCALHAGAWQLWESAAKALKDNAGDFGSMGVSSRLRRFLATSSAIARARALRWLAVDVREIKHQAGQAEAVCMVSASVLSSARNAADMDAGWSQVVSREAALTEAQRAQCEQERINVYYQTLAPQAPDLRPGKVLVAPITFHPGQQPQPPRGPGSPEPAGALQAGSDGSLPSQQPTQVVAPYKGSGLAAALDHSLSLR